MKKITNHINRMIPVVGITVIVAKVRVKPTVSRRVLLSVEAKMPLKHTKQRSASTETFSDKILVIS